MAYESKVVAKLAEQIFHHKRLYYSGKPEISDPEYDRLEEQLRRLSPNHPVLAYVGTEPSAEAAKVKHEVPMLSLAKTYDEGELASWQKDRPVMGMLKIDGNSLALVYEGQQLKLAKTRGNGRVGENVTQKARWVPDIVPELTETFPVEIRGELFCTESQFVQLADEIVRLGLEKPTSPRNIVAGLLGRKTHYNLTRYFNFFAFEVLVPGGEIAFATEEEKFAWLSQRGFRLPQPKLLQSSSEVSAYLNLVKRVMTEDEIGIDGAVFSYNDLVLHRELGSTSHHPRYKMSFKWQGQTAISTIESLQWATSRHGVVTPVAVIEPVQLSGAKITNVTLHNAAHVRTYNLKAGDKIQIVRSGEVIPKFLEVVHAAKGEYTWPEVCPQCETRLEFDDVRLRCPNVESCPAQQSGTILNWIRSVEIDDLSEKRLAQMLELGLVETIPDLYRLEVADFLKLPQTKEKMATKLYKNIQGSKTVDLARFLTGLGVAGAGLTSWERLIAAFGSLKGIQAAGIEDIAAVEGFAEKSATQIWEGLQERAPLIEELMAVGCRPTVNQVALAGGEGPLSGKQIAITGSLSSPRAEVQKMIKQAGGKPVTSVSKHTYAVVTGDPSSTSSKMQKARELGVLIWAEDDLKKAIEAH